MSGTCASPRGSGCLLYRVEPDSGRNASQTALDRTPVHRYLRAFETESALLAERRLPRQPSRIRFYPLNAAQVGSLMAATAILRPQGGILPSCVSFLIGLLYSTGLRLGKALALNHGDVDMKDATLFVRNGKWHKQRLVVMGDSTCEAVRSWETL